MCGRAKRIDRKIKATAIKSPSDKKHRAILVSDDAKVEHSVHSQYEFITAVHSAFHLLGIRHTLVWS